MGVISGSGSPEILCQAARNMRPDFMWRSDSNSAIAGP